MFDFSILIESASQQLWMSYNPIDKLTGIEKLRELKVLFIGNCKVFPNHRGDHLTLLPTTHLRSPRKRNSIGWQTSLTWRSS